MTVLGLMSGTSLDGVDFAVASFKGPVHCPEWQLIAHATVPYTAEWHQTLSTLSFHPAKDMLVIDRALGDWLGRQARLFIDQQLDEPPTFIASHGHTFWHDPGQGVSHQIGHGAALARASGLPVVCDFRSSDIAYGGEGAPLAPAGDFALFPDFDYFLNAGGIVNVAIREKQLGFDITGCNLAFNYFAQKAGYAFDKDGQLAKQGRYNEAWAAAYAGWPFHADAPPKTLDAETVIAWVKEIDAALPIPPEDAIHTLCHAVASAVANALAPFHPMPGSKLLLTGGGAHHPYLVTCLSKALPASTVIPQKSLIDSMEALLFAYLGWCRWQGVPNTISSVTGAAKATTGGAIYLP